MRGTLLFLLFTIALSSGRALAQEAHSDVWSEPNPGVRYLHRTTDLPCTIHALVVDLSADGVRIEATPYEERWQSVGSWARETDAVAAVNGGFWSGFARPDGIAAGGGEPWPGAEDDADHGFFAVDDSGRAFISPPEVVEEEIPSRVRGAVSGRPMIVRGGEVDTLSLDTFEHARNRHPRTAVGVSRDGRTVYFVVADGRRAHSRGQNLYELAELMRELGAYDAINLDGGGSSTMYVESLGGVVNAPSGGRWESALGLGADEEVARERVARDGIQESWVRGVEREVMNHVGVFAPRPESMDVASANDTLPRPDDVRAPSAPPPRAPLFRLGTAREVLYPLLWGFVCAVPLFLALAIWRRRRRA